MDRSNRHLTAAFATALHGMRERAGLTQEQLAENADISARYISFLETRRRQPSLATLYALSVGLGVRLQDIAAEVDRALERTDGDPTG